MPIQCAYSVQEQLLSWVGAATTCGLVLLDSGALPSRVLCSIQMLNNPPIGWAKSLAHCLCVCDVVIMILVLRSVSCTVFIHQFVAPGSPPTSDADPCSDPTASSPSSPTRQAPPPSAGIILQREREREREKTSFWLLLSH